MHIEDKTITCMGCKKEFTYGVEEQKRHAELGYSQEPKRCPECRMARKEKAAARKANPRPSQEVGATGDFAAPPREKRERGGSRGGGRRQGRGAFGGGGGSWGGQERSERPGGFGGGFGGGGGGGFSSGPRQSFDAVCAACGTKTTVPFEPTPGRQVFCRDCFKKR